MLRGLFVSAVLVRGLFVLGLFARDLLAWGRGRQEQRRSEQMVGSSLPAGHNVFA